MLIYTGSVFHARKNSMIGNRHADFTDINADSTDTFTLSLSYDPRRRLSSLILHNSW
jgi:hypothetical protein